MIEKFCILQMNENEYFYGIYKEEFYGDSEIETTDCSSLSPKLSIDEATKIKERFIKKYPKIKILKITIEEIL